MDWEFIAGVIIIIAVILFLLVVALRNMNHNYTIGSGMFKMSENNLETDKHLDSADYNFYDDDGILK